jgi:hypothetical protein
VAQQVLDFTEVGTAVEFMGGEAVAQGMGGHFFAEVGFIGVGFDDEPEALAGQLLAAMVEEKGFFFVAFEKVGTAVLQIVGKDVFGFIIKRQFAGVVVAGGTEQGVHGEVYIFDAERDGLGDAHSGGIEQVEQGGVAEVLGRLFLSRGFEEAFDIFGR